MTAVNTKQPNIYPTVASYKDNVVCDFLWIIFTDTSIKTENHQKYA